MALGSVVRRILGKRAFAVVGRCYRRVFVDLRALAEAVSPLIPRGASVLDVGGGDGEPLNHLLALRPDITVTMIDLAAEIGDSVEQSYLTRVRRLPGTAMSDYLERAGVRHHAVLVSDVVHHVPLPARADFFADLARLAATRCDPGAVVIVKDVEPGGVRAWLGWMADRYVSGDAGVALVSENALRRHVEEAFGDVAFIETALCGRDYPNYAIAFKLGMR